MLACGGRQHTTRAFADALTGVVLDLSVHSWLALSGVAKRPIANSKLVLAQKAEASLYRSGYSERSATYGLFAPRSP